MRLPLRASSKRLGFHNSHLLLPSPVLSPFKLLLKNPLHFSHAMQAPFPLCALFNSQTKLERCALLYTPYVSSLHFHTNLSSQLSRLTGVFLTIQIFTYGSTS